MRIPSGNSNTTRGPVLEATKNTVGVVSGIQGLRWFEVIVKGEEGHAGTTPHRGRRDAVVSAVQDYEDLKKQRDK